MTLYEAVYTRKSIRNFRKDKVETSILEGMIQFYHEMEPLFPGIETSIELIDTQGSKKMCIRDRYRTCKGRPEIFTGGK